MLLMEQSDITSTIVVQYLPPALASRALAAMTPHKREQVLGHMSNPALLDQADVKKIEDLILARIDYILGGEEKIASIIEQAPVSLQSEILSAVRRQDPLLGRRLDRRLVLIEDIGLLGEAELAALSRTATVRGIAVVLKYTPRLRETVLPKLKTGLGEWLTQETSLIGELPEQVKELERRRVLQAFSKLVQEGKIVLRKDFAPPPLPAAEAPAYDPAPGIPVNGAA
jgi:flagellar motor switch protein FliG